MMPRLHVFRENNRWVKREQFTEARRRVERRGKGFGYPYKSRLDG